MDPGAALAFVAVGAAAGVLSGMFGVGGAVLTTPGIRALGVTPLDAVGSTIPAILPASVAGAHRYARAGMVDRRVALVCGGSGTAFALAGAWVSDIADARWLMVLTAALLAWVGVATIRKSRAGGLDRPDEEDQGAGATSTAASGVMLVLVGGAAGFVAGLLGVGGGIVMMPLFTGVLKLPVKVAVASSLVAVAIFSVPSMISHALLDHIDWPVALLLVVGTVPGARLGSRIAIGTGDRTMRLLLGAFFCLVAAVYGGRELQGILSG